jgi:hypothetical protein
MDIATQAEICLREAGFDTWVWTGLSPAVTCFESPSLVGFIHVFEGAAEMLNLWDERQRRVLARYAPSLRLAGAKAWNVYSVFLTSEDSPGHQRSVAQLEEDFTLTRKITRLAVLTVEDVAQALMPLVPIRSQPLLESAHVADRLRSRAKDIPQAALDAFLGGSTAEDVADILGASR